ncbi:MAG: hypothetical protein H7323_17490 [Frankiales bacterium]|nr:hypothetical protein [Frankiales bacterium]
MSTPSLPGATSRGRTYAFMGGVVATLLTLSVALPLALGDRPQTAPTGGPDTLAFSTPGPGAALLPSGAPAVSTLPGASPAPGTIRPDGSTVPAASGQAAAPGQSGGQAPGVPAAPDAGGTAPVPAGGAAARTASDQGVTADSVTLGVFIIDFGRANDVGASFTGYSPAEQKNLANAFAAETNAKGGIAGRRLVLAFQTVDILDQQTMRDACTNFAETDKVFAVTQVLGVYGDPILKCAQDLKLPYLANDGAVSSYYRQAQGYIFTTQPSTLRTQIAMVRELVRLGELKGRKVGFLFEDGYLTADNRATIDELKRNGITPVEGVTSASDVALALRQIPPIARDFCTKKVDYVLYAVNSIYGAQFAQNMERFGCRPAYAMSDFDFTMNGDAFPQDMPNSWFDRALSITSSRTGEGRVGKPEPAHDVACRQTFQRRTGLVVDRNTAADSKYSSVVNACTLQELFAQGFIRAGTNPTRATFVRALAGLGAFENGNYGPSSFNGKTDAPDAVRVTRGVLSCKCWQPQTDFFRPG